MRFFIIAISCILLFSCNSGEKIPDVSHIKVDITTERFEKDLFSCDTNQMIQCLTQLSVRYPFFSGFFNNKIINTPSEAGKDSAAAYIASFVGFYRPVYDSASKLYKDFGAYELEIKKGLQFVKYYFPDYVLPKKITTYIGPLDGYGDMITSDGLVVGLHHHLGKFSLYNAEWVAQTYPNYITNRFEPQTISINAMRNVLDDMYPEKLDDKSLIIQMVEKGKRLYVLSKLQPFAKEYRLIGYTEKQLKEAYQYEQEIWDLFAQNNLLQTSDANVIKNYIGESPKTQELGEASPGNIGSFAGWQIVKKYMKKNPEVSLKQLMQTDAEMIYEAAKYKP